MKLEYDVIVIGSGVAGMTAAIYLKRAGFDVLILEKGAPGGQINQTAKIENYPGFLEIDGPTLAMNMFDQIQKLNVSYEYGTVTEINTIGNKKEVKTDLATYTADAILLATGRVPQKLGLENENNFINRGISWCALCDGGFYKGQEVAVIGSGNSALEEALYLSEICSKVIMINRKDQYKGSKLVLERLKKKANVTFMYNCVIKTLMGKSDVLSGLIVEKNGIEDKININGLFIYIGYHPDTEILKDSPIILENGYILVDEHMKTNVDGIYACGDVIKKEVYQIATAIGEGATAATQIQKDLSIK